MNNTKSCSKLYNVKENTKLYIILQIGLPKSFGLFKTLNQKCT